MNQLSKLSAGYDPGEVFAASRAGRRRGRQSQAGAFLLLLNLVAGVSQAAELPQSRNFTESATPVLKQFCFDCHGAKKAKGHINLETLARERKFADDFKDWERVVAMLEKGEMPPEDKPQPSGEQRQKLLLLIHQELDRSIARQAGDPGRIVLRRLTSAEYAWTIRDLTGLDLGLEKTFGSDAVGGEGFSNIGDVQFVQDSTLERYLEAAKVVASHAIIGAAPLSFFRHPGQTGLELSAIERIDEIYRQHGFRTGSGEGGEAFGLEKYAKAFYAAWRYRHRGQLGGSGEMTLSKLAEEEGIEARFLQHIWNVVNDSTLIFPAAEIAGVWQGLPSPERVNPETVRAACGNLYSLLRSWQNALAGNSGDEEEAPVLDENFQPSLTHPFRVRVTWPKGATVANVEISVIPASPHGQPSPAILWKQPRIRFRQAAIAAAQAPPRRGDTKLLKDILSEESATKVRLGVGFDGQSIGAGDFVTRGAVSLPIQFRVPEGSARAELLVEAQLDIAHGDDCFARCVISDASTDGKTVAATGAPSALLSNPKGPDIEAWKTGIAQFARFLPQISHREAAPADRDPIPKPFDNGYNNAERNSFHYVIKYHRDDRFLVEHILDDTTRARLDEAWTDLLSAFDYYDTWMQFVAKKFKLDLEGRKVASLTQDWISRLPDEPKGFVQWLHDGRTGMQKGLLAAEAGHVEDALGFARRAWRRPLTGGEENRLRSFYVHLRQDSHLAHAGAIRSLVCRILLAPGFLYRLESPPPGTGVVALSNWELASRLSYFLWSSLPDAELERAAAAGQLASPEELARQARRMLRDPKARRLATEFFGQWFGFYRFDDYRGIDIGRFPQFSEELKSAMYDEAVSFFEHIVREDRPVREILFADYTFLNRKLAGHYGIDRPTPTNEMARVDGVSQFKRGGLLQLGAVLAVTSAPLRTSPVKRGDWILRRVLGTRVPPPPGDAGSIPPDDVLADGKTMRARLEAHRRDPSCVNCHARMDPLGFALEHFDPIGQWRDKYRDGQEIEASGKLSDGAEISGLDGLRNYLRSHHSSFERTLCLKVLGYALGRGELATDRPLLQKMSLGLESDNHFSSLIMEIVASTQFRYQRATEPEAKEAKL